MFDVIFPYCANQNFNLGTAFSTMLGTCSGAILAFALNVKYTNKAEKEKKISELILFIYDLNIILKFLMLLYSDIEDILQEFAKGYRSKRTILFHNPIQFDERPLHFIVNENPRLYESIIHTKNDISVIWGTMIEYNDACREGIENREVLLFKMWYQIIRVVPKIHTNMLALNIYYKTIFKRKTLIRGYLINIVKETTEFLVNFVKDKEDILYSDNTKFNKLTNKDYTDEEKHNLEFIYNDCIANFYDKWIENFSKNDEESLLYISDLVGIILKINKRKKEK